MINSRKLDDLDDDAYLMCRKFEAQCFAIGVPIVITSTLRDQEYQDWLYEQGRSRPGPVVTWTHNSRHLPNPKTGKSRAWDFAVLTEERKPTWDAKIDVNENEIPDYLDAAEIARGLGLVAGADFRDRNGNSLPDLCHVEMPRKEKK